MPCFLDTGPFGKLLTAVDHKKLPPSVLSESLLRKRGKSMQDYVEQRDGGYYIAGTRIALDSIVLAFKDGESPETILRSFPMAGPLVRVYGAIIFYLENKEKVEAYLDGSGAALGRREDEGNRVARSSVGAARVTKSLGRLTTVFDRRESTRVCRTSARSRR